MNDPLEISVSGLDLLTDPMLNKGTAFAESERTEFALHGLLPPHIGRLEDQAARRLTVLRGFETDFQRYAYLRDLQDTNETLFYAVLVRNLEELLPLVYTPVVGEGCQRFSEIWRKPRGLFLSYPNRHRIAPILSHPRYDRVRVIVVSDGERILGLGDQGAGGMGIPIGKLSLYTACAGIHPCETLPVLLDVGTDNADRLDDPMYIGWRHERVRGAAYDEFVESFVAAVTERWPHVLLQWEDFAGVNAATLLERYRNRICSFNDDIQGTAAVAAGTLLAAIHLTAVPLSQQRIVLVGAGAAGTGIGGLMLRTMADSNMAESDARARFWAVDRDGLLLEGMPGLRPSQEPFARTRASVEGWQLVHPDRIGLLDVVRNVKPTALIGVSGQQGAFTEEVVRAMAGAVQRPVIFPLSNPTSRSEASPEDLIAWSDGRAIIGTGSPFPPVYRNGKWVPVDQINNSYIFPGLGLGILAGRARRVSTGMFLAAAKALAGISPAKTSKGGRLLPPVHDLRSVAVAVAMAVARRAQADGVADACDPETVSEHIQENVWEPVYRPYRLRQ